MREIEVWQVTPTVRLIRKLVADDLPVQRILEQSPTTDILGEREWRHVCQWPESEEEAAEDRFINKDFTIPSILADALIDSQPPTRVVVVLDGEKAAP